MPTLSLFDPTHVLDGADFSRDKQYRYRLWRSWNADEPLRSVLIVGLNPSTANANADVNDRTISKEITFARQWGFNQLVKVNLFAAVTAHPQQLILKQDPIGGMKNDATIKVAAETAELVVGAWGGLPGGFKEKHRRSFDRRVATVLELINRDVWCLGVTTDNHPKHTSRLAYDSLQQLFWSPDRPHLQGGALWL